jgi:hypothetical protein
MVDDAGLRKDRESAIQPKSVPAASRRVLESAERRLIGSIKHGEPRPKLIASAERVRRAQLGCLKASVLAASLPTDDDDEQRQRYQANLADARSAWESTSVDDIIDVYSRNVTKAR